MIVTLTTLFFAGCAKRPSTATQPEVVAAKGATPADVSTEDILRPLTSLGIKVEGPVKGKYIFNRLGNKITEAGKRVSLFASESEGSLTTYSEGKPEETARIAQQVLQINHPLGINAADLRRHLTEAAGKVAAASNVHVVVTDTENRIRKLAGVYKPSYVDVGESGAISAKTQPLVRIAARPNPSLPVILIMPAGVTSKEYSAVVDNAVSNWESASKKLITLLHASAFFDALTVSLQAPIRSQYNLGEDARWIASGLAEAAAVQCVGDLFGTDVALQCVGIRQAPKVKSAGRKTADPRPTSGASDEDALPSGSNLEQNAAAIFHAIYTRSDGKSYQSFLNTLRSHDPVTTASCSAALKRATGKELAEYLPAAAAR